MPIEVNSTMYDWVENETVSMLLKRLNFIYPMIIVKVNGVVVPRTSYGDVAVPDGAVLDIMHIESGG